ncbi:hypothetical protein [uncultured Dysosmobacter sp.]|uniref:hypothetical protein n=1 Tax=uncultured Dysosmobacter sp. TaxID=2591384 RepID=UPI00260ABF0F|nr:hypothetical protein [uncultured Dysosmobacter sp.]
MRSKHPIQVRQLTAAALACLTAASVIPAASAAEPIGDGVAPSYDEAYYATLDYYGNLTEGSVVKSYVLNGATTLTDYGVYDEVVNLTDGTAPTRLDGATEFRFDGAGAPSHFYFEGKTARPFAELPWTIAISYTLNGVPAKAEDLAGKTGVVEIKLDIVPNENAGEYARNNYTLEAVAMFNQDDILSLEAPGAQVQLIGNLRSVLFIALPGEEQHFVIRVGSEDFSFGGMTFMMVPATLAQLEEITKLSQRKDDLEEDYNKLSGSLDTLLDSFASLGGSLRATADGLDELNRARDTISSGKGQIYDDGDRVLDDLEKLNGSLNTLPGHLDDADDAVTEVTDSMSDLTDTAVGLQRELDDLDDCLQDLQRDIRTIRGGTGDMQDHLKKLGEDLKRLQASLDEIRGTLKLLDIRINGGLISELPERIQQNIKVQDRRLDEVLKQVNALEGAFAAVAGTDGQGAVNSAIGYEQFAAAAIMVSAAQKGMSLTPEQAAGQLAQMQAAVIAVETAVAETIRQSAAAGQPLDKAAALQQVLAAMKAGSEQQRAAAAAYEQALVMQQVYTAVCGGTEKPMTKADFFTAILMLNDINQLQNPAQADIAAILEKKAAYAQTGKLLSELNGDYDLAKVTGLLENLSALLEHMGSGGLTGDLGSLVGKTDTALGHLNGTADVGRDILDRAEDLLDDLEDLDDTINDQVPGLRDTLRDTKTLVRDMVATVDDTHGFLTSFRSLAKTSGSQLDEGTRKSLENLAATLRKTAHSTDAVGDVKTAKDAVNEIIEDTWHEYTGDINNMLLMDASAQPVSLTSERNGAPQSIQILIRSQEIQADSGDTEAAGVNTGESTTFWGRIARMFQDFWNAVTGIFH